MSYIRGGRFLFVPMNENEPQLTADQEALMTVIGKRFKAGATSFHEGDLATELGWTVQQVNTVMIELAQAGLMRPTNQA